YVREIFLEVAVGGTDDDYARRRGGLELSHHFDLARDADERIFGWRIPIRGRVGRGTLNVRIVIRRTCRALDDSHAKLCAEVNELNRFGEIVFSGIILIRAERAAIGNGILF